MLQAGRPRGMEPTSGVVTQAFSAPLVSTASPNPLQFANLVAPPPGFAPVSFTEPHES